MSVYLVTYDLNKEVHRPNIVGAIKKNWDWAKLSESSYAIQASLSPAQVLAMLRPLIDENDNIYVVTLRAPYIGFGPADVNKWLSDRL